MNSEKAISVGEDPRTYKHVMPGAVALLHLGSNYLNEYKNK